MLTQLFLEHKCLTKTTFSLTHFDCATCKYSIILLEFLNLKFPKQQCQHYTYLPIMNTNRSPSLKCSLRCNSPIPTGYCKFCESCRLTWLSIFVSIKSIFWTIKTVFIFMKVCICVCHAQLRKLKRDWNMILNSLFIYLWYVGGNIFLPSANN